MSVAIPAGGGCVLEDVGNLNLHFIHHELENATQKVTSWFYKGAEINVFPVMFLLEFCFVCHRGRSRSKFVFAQVTPIPIWQLRTLFGVEGDVDELFFVAEFDPRVSEGISSAVHPSVKLVARNSQSVETQLSCFADEVTQIGQPMSLLLAPNPSENLIAGESERYMRYDQSPCEDIVAVQRHRGAELPIFGNLLSVMTLFLSSR